MKYMIYHIIAFSLVLSVQELSSQAKADREKCPDLFSPELKKSPDAPLCAFAERYLHELSNSRPEEARKKMDADKFAIEYGNPAIIPFLDASKDVRIAIRNDKRCFITWWDKEDELLSISFPIQYELILGLNKIEIENRLKDKLLHFSTTFIPEPVKEEDLIPAGPSNFFIATPGFYQVENMRSDQYYIKEENRVRLLDDTGYPLETLSNLMTSGLMDYNIKVNITQKKYNNKQEHILIPLNQWTSACLSEGCIPYFGIEYYDEHIVRATVIMENRRLGYIHIFFFTFPLQLLQKKSGRIDATLYAYIPVHNLNNLFDDYKIRLRDHKPKYSINNPNK